jgi:uncharacterized protein YhbP (UPF0306 family)
MSDSTARNELRLRIESFLNEHHVMSLATLGPEGPHAANLFYACDGLSLLWISDPKSRHSRELEAQARVATTIAPDYTDFSIIRGVQIWGVAYKVSDSERAKQIAVLENRYVFLRRTTEGPKKMHDAYSQAAIYRLDPERIVFIDNTKGFGHKETLDV